MAGRDVVSTNRTVVYDGHDVSLMGQHQDDHEWDVGSMPKTQENSSPGKKKTKNRRRVVESSIKMKVSKFVSWNPYCLDFKRDPTSSKPHHIQARFLRPDTRKNISLKHTVETSLKGSKSQVDTLQNVVIEIAETHILETQVAKACVATKSTTDHTA